MSKVQYVGDKHMTAYKCVTSFGRITAHCLVSMPKMRGEQRSSINYVFGTDFKRNTAKSRKRIWRQEN